jgi:hypothetical protein
VAPAAGTSLSSLPHSSKASIPELMLAAKDEIILSEVERIRAMNVPRRFSQRDEIF